MKFRPSKPCGLYRLTLRNANGFLTGRRVHLAQSPLLPGEYYGYDPKPEKSYGMIEYSPGQYEAQIEGGYLYDIYIDGVLWADFSPIYFPDCTNPVGAIVTPPPIPTPTCDPTPIVEGSSVTFCWSLVTGATFYNLQVSTTVNFNPGDIVLDVAGTLGPCYTHGAGFAPALYYWRVQAVSNGGATSDWSNMCLLDVRTALEKPVLDCPATMDDTTPHLFDWTDVVNAVTYDFQLARDPAFTDLITSVTGLVVSQYLFNGDLTGEGTTLYWRARAVGQYFNGPWSDTCTVTINPVFEIYAQSSASISTRWRHFRPIITSYKLERTGVRNSDNYPYLPISYRAVDGSPTTGGGTGNYVDLELLPGYTYLYRLTPQIAGVDTTPVMTATGPTNPDGALSTDHVGAGGQHGGGGMQEETGPYTIYTLPYGPRAYYGGFTDLYSRGNVVEFVLKNTGTESGGKIIWGRKDEESWGVGTIMAYTAIEKSGSRLSYYLGSMFGDTFRFTATLDHPLGETHHWAFVMKTNLDGIITHKVFVYRDGVQSDEVTFTTRYRMRGGWMAAATMYAHKAWSQFMLGVKGVVDEFRIWNIPMEQSLIDEIKYKVIRKNDWLVYRWGFDNYSGLGGVSDFNTLYYGQVLQDSEKPNDVAGGTPTAFNFKHIVEPLFTPGGSITPSTPILLTPADNTVFDATGGLFTWFSPLADHAEFQLATDVGFTNIIYSNTNVIGQQINLPLSLIANATYYWRVRAVRDGNFSAWATPFSFVVNVNVDIFLTEPYPGGRDEPFDATTLVLLTQPTGARNDEPFNPTTLVLLTQPTGERNDEPFNPTTEVLLTIPTFTIADV